MSTLYHVLGLSREASEQQVKAAFRALARRFHPDVNAGDQIAEQRFKEVNQAYETLADPKARVAYDRALVCQQTKARGRSLSLVATATATLALTVSVTSLAVWLSRHNAAVRPELLQTRSVVSTPNARVQQGAVKAPKS